MREVCEQCRRVIQSWREPVIHADRIFCDEICVEDYVVNHDQSYASHDPSPIEGFMLPALDQRSLALGDP